MVKSKNVVTVNEPICKKPISGKVWKERKDSKYAKRTSLYFYKILNLRKILHSTVNFKIFKFANTKTTTNIMEEKNGLKE